MVRHLWSQRYALASNVSSKYTSLLDWNLAAKVAAVTCWFWLAKLEI